MPVIDTYTIFGSWPAGGADLSLPRLKESLEGRDVEWAIAHSTDSVFETTPATLSALRGAISGVPNLSPAAVIDPTLLVKPWELAEQVATENYACIRFFPEVHEWPVGSFEPFDRCMAAIEPSGTPVSVAITKSGQLTALSRISNLDRMPVILVHLADDCMSEVAAVLPQRENWYVSTDGLDHLGLLEELVDAVGGQRILFGSSAPRGSIQGALNYVKYADLPDSIKQQILYDNAKQVFGGRLAAH